MRSLSLTLLAAGLAVAQPAAQGSAFPVPDNLPGVGICNAIPFGSTNGSSSWLNQRHQWVVTVADMNAQPCLITGLSFAPCSTGIHMSTSIRLTLALVQPGFDLLTNTNFDANLQGATFSQVVLDRQDYRWRKTANTWSPIGIDSSFVYDGVSDLLVDVIVEGNSSSDGNNAMHRDVRPRLYATGWTGSPPATGSASSAAIKIRIESGCAELSGFGTGCAGLVHSLSGSSALGATVSFDVSGGAPFMPAALNLGSLNTTPFPIDLTALGFTGCEISCSADLGSLGGVTDPNGTRSLALPIPNVATLVGIRLFSQYLHLNASAPGGAATSNGGRVVLGGGC
ncbi:MAG: hypothetical protein IPM29_30680 [Planctomycetes bacterium]|nr:hypothetical protein [Planctomycetota bacterium]